MHLASSQAIARSLVTLTVLAMLCVRPSLAGAQDADALAKQTQNPIASLISVPLQGNWDFGLGDRDATGTLLNFQPVVPLRSAPARTSSFGSSCR